MKHWWQKKKVWGTIFAALLRLFGHKFGIDAEAAADGALIILGGVTVEGIVDSVSAFRSQWKEPA